MARNPFNTKQFYVLDNNHQFKYAIIGMESTDFYAVHITNYLSASDKLSPFSVHVYCQLQIRGRIAVSEETACNSYKLDKCLYEPLTISITSSFNCISSFEKELKAIKPNEYTVLNSIPGIGKAYSAGILAELGSIKAFQNSDALAKYCGIVWNDNLSCEFEAEDKKMSKFDNRYLRFYIIEVNMWSLNGLPLSLPVIKFF